jgi:chromosome segregation ATPase
MDDQTQHEIKQVEAKVTSLTSTVFTRLDQQRDELNAHYKDLADIRARMGSQERLTGQLLTTISDNRAEHKSEMSELRRELSAAIAGLKGSVDELNKSYAEARGGVKVGKWLIESSKLGLAGLAGWLASIFTSGGGA